MFCGAGGAASAAENKVSIGSNGTVKVAKLFGKAKPSAMSKTTAVLDYKTAVKVMQIAKTGWLQISYSPKKPPVWTLPLYVEFNAETQKIILKGGKLANTYGSEDAVAAGKGFDEFSKTYGTHALKEDPGPDFNALKASIALNHSVNYFEDPKLEATVKYFTEAGLDSELLEEPKK